MKNNNLVLFGLLALGVYLVTRKKATPPPATTYTPPPATDTYLPTGEQTTKPPATTRPPIRTYTPPPGSTTPPVVVDQWAATPNAQSGEGYAINGYFPSKLPGGVIELPYGARWYHQEPTTTKNARMVL